MGVGSGIPIRPVEDNSCSYAEDYFSTAVEDSSVYTSYPSQTDSFEICEEPEATRSFDDLRTIFEEGASHPMGSDERWDAVSALFEAFVLADQRGDRELASTIEGHIRNLGYTIHMTFEQGPDHSGPRRLTYNISGPLLPPQETLPPPPEAPPQPADAPPPAQRHRPRRREQVATEEQPPPADNPPDPTPEPEAPTQAEVTMETIMSYFPAYESPYTQERVTQEDQQARQEEELAGLETDAPPDPGRLVDTEAARLSAIEVAFGIDFESPLSLNDQFQQQRDIGAEIQESLAATSPDPSAEPRVYDFVRTANGDYIYRDPDGRNEVIIHPDGRMEDRTNVPLSLDVIAYIFGYDNPPLPLYMYHEIEDATSEARQRMADETDMSYTREALDGLSVELSQIIERHQEWSLAQQHDFLFRRWDECREDSVGNEARTTIIEFIRAHYPQGSCLEFTEDEIVAMNERQMTESMTFSPYDYA